MKIEFEAAFLDIDRDEIREKIKSIGGECSKKNTLMRRVIFENQQNPKDSYLRVRDEGGKVTCCMKTENTGTKNIESVKELETEVQDFEVMKSIFIGLGIRQKAYQETYREIWEIPGEIEFMIDEWPGIKPFIEVEGINEDQVKKYSELLGFYYNDAVFGTVGEIYEKTTSITAEEVNQIAEITFDNPPVT